MDPLPETREVYQAVLEEWSIRGGPRFAPPTWTTLPSLDAPLVGREAAMGKLEAALAQTHAGAGSAVLVSGEAGVGKSRLLETFVREHAGEAAVLNGSGYEGQGEVPYLPLVEALRPLLPRVDWASLKADPLHLAALVRLLPELRRHVPNLPEPSSVEGEQ